MRERAKALDDALAALETLRQEIADAGGRLEVLGVERALDRVRQLKAPKGEPS